MLNATVSMKNAPVAPTKAAPLTAKSGANVNEDGDEPATVTPTQPGKSLDREARLVQRLACARAARDAAPDAATARAKQTEVDALQWELALCGQVVVRAEMRRLGAIPLNRDDLFQEGLVALFDAASRFECGRGLRFSTYARWRVRHHLQTVVARLGPVMSRPASALRDQSRVRRELAAVSRAGGTIDDAELADRAGLPVRRVRLVRETARPVSFSRPREDGLAPADWLSAGTPDPVRRIQAQRRRRALGRLLSQADTVLDEREQRIVRQRFLSDARPKPRAALGRELGLSGERVRQLEKRALRRLRDALAADA